MILSLTGVNLVRGEGDWPLSPELRSRVDDHWQRVVADNPRLWNGRVLGTVAPGWPGGISVGDDGVLAGTALEGDFASFLAWRDWGFPEIGLRNLFGSALVLSSDGALLFGVMSAVTANPGKVYPPGGSLEPRDVLPDGRVDVLGSIALELHEETGLDIGDGEPVALLAAFDGPRVSVARAVRFAATARDLEEAVRAHLAAGPDPELAGIAVIRSPADLPGPDRCPPYAAALATHLLGG